MMGPIIDEIGADNEDINVCKMNVDENSESPVGFGIRGIPTLIFFKNGEIIDKLVGVSSKAALQAKIDSLK
jgi:thioredoxin 1